MSAFHQGYCELDNIDCVLGLILHNNKCLLHMVFQLKNTICFLKGIVARQNVFICMCLTEYGKEIEKGLNTTKRLA